MVITFCIKNTKYILFLIKSTVSTALLQTTRFVLSTTCWFKIATLVFTSWCKRSALCWLILQYSWTNLKSIKDSFPKKLLSAIKSVYPHIQWTLDIILINVCIYCFNWRSNIFSGLCYSLPYKQINWPTGPVLMWKFQIYMLCSL